MPAALASEVLAVIWLGPSTEKLTDRSTRPSNSRLSMPTLTSTSCCCGAVGAIDGGVVGVALGSTDALGLGVAEALAEGDGDGLVLGLALGMALGDSVGARVGDADAVGLGERLALGLGVSRGLGVKVGVATDRPLPDGVGVGPAGAEGRVRRMKMVAPRTTTNRAPSAAVSILAVWLFTTYQPSRRPAAPGRCDRECCPVQAPRRA